MTIREGWTDPTTEQLDLQDAEYLDARTWDSLISNVFVLQQVGNFVITTFLGYSNSTTLTCGYAGSVLRLGGFLYVLPAAVTLSNGGLLANAVYYAYFRQDAGVVSLEAIGSTPHTTDTTRGNRGTEIMVGDRNRTLAGIFATTGGVFADSLQQRFVRSWGNTPNRALRAPKDSSQSSGVLSTTSTSWTELNSALRLEFVSWQSDSVVAYVSGSVTNSGASNQHTGIGLDGTNPLDGSSVSGGTVKRAAVARDTLHQQEFGLNEGYHYLTLLGRVEGGTATWAGGLTYGERTVITAMLLP